ncbi:glycosyltransferase [Cohnella sp. GCM10027633]|uniref:MGDG synthase family glycosyltransferase n=1 Tax=unclassified Cohnella TaxID=2636738 RepID=UPI00363DA02B
MNRRMKLLIVYARFGDGHLQAAAALRDSFTRLGLADAQTVDLLAQSHPLLNEVSKFVYRQSYTLFPRVYGWVYESTKHMKSDSSFAHWLHSFGKTALRKLVLREQPDAVIHTFPSLALPAIYSRVGRRVPMFNVVTDFDLHMRWVHPQVDKYYVATDDLRLQLAGLGIDDRRIAATGIPLRPSFADMEDMPERAAIARQFGIPNDKLTVLVMGGAYGNAADLRTLCEKLSERPDVHTVVVCGRNRAIRADLHRRMAARANVAVLGYVDRIDVLMRLATCIVTKPGGLTTSEAIEAGLPIFLYRPVPGQERNNARYLQRRGAAVVCRSTGELIREISRLLEDPRRLAAMRQALDLLRKGRAADRIALDIADQLHIMEEASVPRLRS